MPTCIDHRGVPGARPGTARRAGRRGLDLRRATPGTPGLRAATAGLAGCGPSPGDVADAAHRAALVAAAGRLGGSTCSCNNASTLGPSPAARAGRLPARRAPPDLRGQRGRPARADPAGPALLRAARGTSSTSRRTPPSRPTRAGAATARRRPRSTTSPGPRGRAAGPAGLRRSTPATCAPRCTRTRSRARTSPTARSRRPSCPALLRLLDRATRRAAATAPRMRRGGVLSALPVDRRRPARLHPAARARRPPSRPRRAGWPATRCGCWWPRRPTAIRHARASATCRASSTPGTCSSSTRRPPSPPRSTALRRRRTPVTRPPLHRSCRTATTGWSSCARPAARADPRPSVAGEVVDLPRGVAAGAVRRRIRTAPERRGSRLWRARSPGRRPACSRCLARHGRPDRATGYLRDRSARSTPTRRSSPRDPGSAEMPSAGRPFTPELVTDLVAAGRRRRADPPAHRCVVAGVARAAAPERFRVPPATARGQRHPRPPGGRVVAVGTTVVRALESRGRRTGCVAAATGWTDLVLGPDRGAARVDGLITGWHEPEASHLLLLEAVAGPALRRRGLRRRARRAVPLARVRRLVPPAQPTPAAVTRRRACAGRRGRRRPRRSAVTRRRAGRSRRRARPRPPRPGRAGRRRWRPRCRRGTPGPSR